MSDGSSGSSGSKFAPVRGGDNKGKVSIASLDKGPRVEAQYNPKELEISKTVPWSKVNEANKSNGKSTQDQGIHLEFTGAEGRSMTLDLLFDGYEEGTDRAVDVEAKVRDLETLASVRVPNSKKEDERRPHRCVVTWGSTLPEFRCVIDQLTTKYTMFNSAGKPLRAQCTVKLKEADVVSMAKKK